MLVKGPSTFAGVRPIPKTLWVSPILHRQPGGRAPFPAEFQLLGCSSGASVKQSGGEQCCAMSVGVRRELLSSTESRGDEAVPAAGGVWWPWLLADERCRESWSRTDGDNVPLDGCVLVTQAGEGQRGWIIRDTQTIRASVLSSHRGTGHESSEETTCRSVYPLFPKGHLSFGACFALPTHCWYVWGPEVSNSVHKKLKSREMIKWPSWNVNPFANRAAQLDLQGSCHSPADPNPTWKFTPTTSVTFPNFQQLPAQSTPNFQSLWFCVQPDVLCKMLCTNPLCSITTTQNHLAEQIHLFYPKTSLDGITQSPSRAAQCPEPPSNSPTSLLERNWVLTTKFCLWRIFFSFLLVSASARY